MNIARTPSPYAGTATGCLSREELQDALTRGEIDTVLTVFPDLYGRLVGKRITAPFFLDEVMEHGMHVCDYLLACDMEMDPTPGYRFTSWETGYGDMHCRPDYSSARMASWLPRTAIVLCDAFDEKTGEPIAVAPRTILKRQIERAARAGYLAMGGSELELFVFRDTFEAARRKHYAELETFGDYIEDYHILAGTRAEPLIGSIRQKLETSGIPVEFSKGEWGPGQQEINLRYTDFLEMSDRHVLYKHAAKEIAIAHELSLTFMAKWHERHAGNSFHLHSSLWALDHPDRALFAGDEAPIEGTQARPSKLFLHWLAGLIEHAPELMLFFAPTVNSYKRYAAGTFAPTAIGWAYDNRTAGFRVVGHGASLRAECRIPGADANPYLAYAAILAAGLDGIERELTPPPLFRGNLYEASELPQVPTSLAAAIAIARESQFLRDAFGDDVIDHYLHFARTELAGFERVVTDWERARYFERG